MNPMNRTLISTAILTLLIACGASMGGRAIDLSVEGAGGKTVYFNRFENNQAVLVDSVKLDASGSGSMTVASMPLDFYSLNLDSEQLIIAIDSAESLTVEAKLGSFATPASITGSQHTEQLQGFYAEARTYDEEREKIRASISSQDDTAMIGKFNALNSGFYDRCKKFITANASSPAALTALGKLDMQQELPLFQQVRDSLRKTMPRSGFFAMYRDQVDRMEQQGLQIKLQEEEQKRLSNLLPLGSVAPEIRQQTPSGGTLALSELRGKVVLIDFWASWCRPCRMENPNVKRVYEKYAKRGFEIFGVSLDRDQAAWEKAIQDDGLPWKHVSDLGFWNNAAAQEYGVSGIPYTVLVDREGNILDKGLRGAELEAKLDELLGQ